MNGPQIAWLPDGKRLHMNHGPIDLVVEAFGAREETEAAYRQAANRFETILDELVAELGELRRPSGRKPRSFAGPTARRMEEAACRFSEKFITPMAAVAGSVADEMLAALTEGRQLDRAYVNDGGDIAIHLAPGTSIKAAIGGTGHGFADRLEIGAGNPVRGIATSGWRGRSFSLGIADAVTVLAKDGATADAAATVIANAVDLPGHPAIRRERACDLAPDSDLGERLVTTGVGALGEDELVQALERGWAVAEAYRGRGLIKAAALFLGGQMHICGEILSRKFVPLCAPLCPAGHLPLKGVDYAVIDPGSNREHRRIGASVAASVISPLEGEMSGRTEGGNVGRYPRKTHREINHA